MSNTEYFLDILQIVLAADLSFNLGLGAQAAVLSVPWRFCSREFTQNRDIWDVQLIDINSKQPTHEAWSPGHIIYHYHSSFLDKDNMLTCAKIIYSTVLFSKI